MAAARRLAAAPTVGEALPQSMEADGGPARERHGGGRHGGRPQWVPRITESAASDRPRVQRCTWFPVFNAVLGQSE